MKKWMKRIAVAVVLLVCVSFVVGCGLTPEQRAELSLLLGRSEKVGVELVEAKDDIVKAYENFKAGELSREDFAKMFDRYEDLKGEQEAVVARVKELQQKEIPTWLSIIVGIIGLGSGGVFGAKAVVASRALKGALGMFGAVSRAGDKVDNFGDIVRREMAESPGVTEDKLREMHHLASAKEI